MALYLTLLKIFGGVALIVFGVRYLRKGLDRLFGPRLGFWMQKLAMQRGWAFLAGIVVSVLAPSSTTMSLLAVNSVKTGHLTARQMLTIVLGANIGLTVMVLLIGLDIHELAPVILLVGVALFQFTTVNRTRGIGQVLLAIGFILMAVDIMSRAATAAAEGSGAGGGEVQQLLSLLQSHALLVALVATVMAMALQSSTATIGLIIGLGAAHVASMRLAIPIVLGANVGLAMTTLIVGWPQLEPRRLALANLLLKSTVGAAGLAAVAIIGPRMPEPTPANFGLVCAGVHTGYNVLVAIVGLPTVGLVTRLVEVLLPNPPLQSRRAFGPKYIAGEPVEGIALALAQSQREIAHVSEIVRGMLRDCWEALKSDNERLAREVSERDDRVDMLDGEIKRFLTRLTRELEGDYDAEEQMRQLRYLSELETMGDIIDQNLCELVLKKILLGTKFSREGAAELEGFYRQVAENIVIAETAFSTRDKILARQLLRHKERLDQTERELRDRHFERLNRGLTDSHETSAIHLDLLTHLKRINSCVSHVAYAIINDTRARESAPPQAGAA